MDKERSEAIIQKLKERGATHSCPRCGHARFEVVAESQITVVEDRRWTSAVPQVVQTVLVACSNCGFVSQHALGPLGLVEEEANVG